MTTAADRASTEKFLDGKGEMARLTREYNWSASQVGPVEQWPQTLKTTVGIILNSHFPMFLWWGEDMIQFYNDAYRPSLGENGKHPTALGQKAVDCWQEIWHIIYPLIEQVRTTGESFFSEDQLIPIYRNNKLEDVYWTFSYSAVVSENGHIDGVLVICHETTSKVMTLHNLQEMQNKVVQSEANLRNIIQQAPVAMCIFRGPEFVVEIANERMYELWGRARRELVGKPIFVALPEVANQGYEQLLQRVYTTGETFTGYGYPVQLPRSTGLENIYIHFVYEALREGDEIAGVMAIAIDVTEQVNAQNRVKESEHRLRSVIESAPFPIAVYEGREMRVTVANQSIIDVWGKGPGVVGKTYYEVLPELEGQDVYPKLDRVFTSGQPFNARNQLVKLTMHGELKPFYFNYSFTPLFNTDGQVTGVMNTAADITDLHEALQKVEASEGNFKNMILQAPVAMCLLLGPDHIVELANDLMIELWGKPRETVLHKPIFEGLPDAREQGLEKLLHDVFATGNAFHANERPVQLLRNGKMDNVYQNFVYEPYRGGDGTILGVLAITMDVTEQVMARRQIEHLVEQRTAELAAMNRELKNSNAALSQYAYITSHDLQEPARKISTFTEMLRRALGENIDQRAAGYLDKIDVSSTRMLSLIRDVLAFSQLSKSGVRFEPVDLNAVAEAVRSDFELLIEQKGCKIEIGKLPVIDAIPVQMNQLFTNLFSNAIKFSKADEPLHLVVKAEPLHPRERAKFDSLKPVADFCAITFADNGIGFDQYNARRIFEIFQRLHTLAEYRGTGIGLAMCKKIAENHGGEIVAASQPGQGAVFTVVLPLHQ